MKPFGTSPILFIGEILGHYGEKKSKEEDKETNQYALKYKSKKTESAPFFCPFADERVESNKKMIYDREITILPGTISRKRH